MTRRRKIGMGAWALLILLMGGISLRNIHRRHQRLSFESALLKDDLPEVERLLGEGVSANEPVAKTPPLAMALSRFQRTPNPMMRVPQKYPVCEEIALLLMKHGANIEARDSSQATPLLIAAHLDMPNAIRELLSRRADVSAKDSSRRNALHLACVGASFEIVKQLADAGCDIQAVDNFGLTPLGIAAQEARTKTVRFLAERGAKIDVVTSEGLSPFYFAVAAGADPVKRVHALETAKYLLSKGANPRILNKQGESVVALAGHSAAMLEMIRQVGLPFPAPGSKEEASVLRNAISGGNIETAMRCKASFPSLPDGMYDTALLLGQMRQNKAFLDLLTPYMNSKRFALYLKSQNTLYTPSIEAQTTQLIREGKHPLPEGKWQEVLSLAIVANKREMAKAILEKGISIDFWDKDGRTPVIEAAICANPLILKDVLERRPDVNRKSRGGITALGYAKRTKNQKIIRLLEAAGAKD